MVQTNLSIKIDESDKKKFEIFCSETGMSVSVAINIFIKAVLRENKLPFEVKTDPFYSESNIKHLKKIVSDMNTGKIKFEDREKIIEDEDEPFFVFN